MAAATGAGAATAVLVAPAGLATAAGVMGAAGLASTLVGRTRRQRRYNRATPTLPRPAQPLPPASDGAEDWEGVSPLLTPVERFYVTDVNMRAPLVDPATWRLAVHGAVERPLELSLDELAALGVEEFDALMVCIHNRLGWDRLGTQRWTGVPLERVLAAAGASPSARWVVTEAVDGFEVSLPRVLPEPYRGYVVVGMGGRALTATHGAPARVFVPGLYGQYTGAKWVRGLCVRDEPNQDYWLPRGWPRDSAPVRPLSRIDTPARGQRRAAGPLVVAGVAWTPPYGVGGVRVAVNGRWCQAELADELSPASWRRWRLRLELPPGRLELRAECSGRDGRVQSAIPATPFPSGAAGHHRVTLTLS